MSQASVWHVCGTPGLRTVLRGAIEHRKTALTSAGSPERAAGIEPA
jgi:hypothetical protein